MVLEAWCYTRAAGTEVAHVAVTGFQGIPDCVAWYKFPRRWRWLDLYQQQQGALIPMGSVIYTRVAWETASTGSQLFKVHTGSLTLTLFIPCRYLLLTVYTVMWFIVYTREVISITPVPLRRWTLGWPIHSCRAVTAALSGGLPGSASLLSRGCLWLAGTPNLHHCRR